MMKSNKNIVLLILISSLLLLLSACGGNYDFKNGSWGMSLEEITELEMKNGYSEEELEITDGLLGKGLDLSVPNVIIDGHEAVATYTFKNQLDSFDLIPPVINDKKAEKEIANIEKEVEQLPELIYFEDYILVEGMYFFDRLVENEAEKIYNSLVEKYGEPFADEGSLANWYVNDTYIVYYNADGEGETIIVTYSATYNSLKKHIKTNKQKVNDGSL